ncbi:hypothetical protein NDU88_005995 [Pleurodeles waltl]|uniref:Uncharacterized protein n=1 Tax=Pleurodeles waltl TaxID=8319 RepID=A0AAV7MAZ7_PLEWA|nr:hypothetical protein NDU88_005995 [Pleurodeles waltl]
MSPPSCISLIGKVVWNAHSISLCLPPVLHCLPEFGHSSRVGTAPVPLNMGLWAWLQYSGLCLSGLQSPNLPRQPHLLEELCSSQLRPRWITSALLGVRASADLGVYFGSHACFARGSTVSVSFQHRRLEALAVLRALRFTAPPQLPIHSGGRHFE